MKAKNLFLTALFVATGILCVNSAKAQDKTTDEVIVNLVFKPVQSLLINTGQKPVELIYDSKNDYENGQSEVKDNHLTVFSTGGFQVSVKSNGNFKRTGGTEEILTGDVNILAANASGNDLPNDIKSSIALNSTTSTPIIKTNGGGRDLNYNITYDNITAGKGDKYINKYISDDGESSVYTATVTYSITTN